MVASEMQQKELLHYEVELPYVSWIIQARTAAHEMKHCYSDPCGEFKRILKPPPCRHIRIGDWTSNVERVGLKKRYMFGFREGTKQSFRTMSRGRVGEGNAGVLRALSTRRSGRGTGFFGSNWGASGSFALVLNLRRRTMTAAARMNRRAPKRATRASIGGL